jgi:arsenite methyltransferase
MATTAPLDFNVDDLRDQVMTTYAHVAREPHAAYHFHRGPGYAATFLAYDRDELAALCQPRPPRISRALATRWPLARYGPARPCSTTPVVPPWTCCSRRVGPSGCAIGIDMTPAMVEQATWATAEAGMADWVEVHRGLYEALPVTDGTVDVVISNGVLNLAPDKGQVLQEVRRVLKPGGRLYLADVVVQRELTADVRANPDLWAACVGGALVELELPEIAAASGLVDGRVVRRFNCFYGTSAEEKVAKNLFIQSVNFVPRKR